MCEPYYKTSINSVCDSFYTKKDYVYFPTQQTYGQPHIRYFMEELTKNFPFTSECYDAVAKALCTYYYLPCGSNGRVHVPQALCSDVCTYVSTKLCSENWEILKRIIQNFQFEGMRNSIEAPDCSRPCKMIEYLNLNGDCCSDGGVDVPGNAILFNDTINNQNCISPTNNISLLMISFSNIF